jgi:hypothetical protein
LDIVTDLIAADESSVAALLTQFGQVGGVSDEKHADRDTYPISTVLSASAAVGVQRPLLGFLDAAQAR